ncbi:triple tyrosine motif-containing protein [Flammeovirgaceae bacterium SG7u.111]|nr:triple tyrosine motif-containing protein [Flammeovirgaceae bacterium SG7u.132]WPO36009.1 triple tyrosine motif-containing protein [Flammeovirgaceae bacterium SG7u.111]
MQNLKLVKSFSFNFLILFSIVFATKANGNDLFNYGIPFIKHFTKKEYKAGNQNWSITQDDRGFIYVGNSNGLLQYDGLRWKKYNLPGSPIIRSVFADGDRIYSGSLGEFGYWNIDDEFNLSYTSLSDSLPENDFGEEDIWWITKFGDDIIFQTFSITFLYDGNTTTKIISGQGVIFPPFLVNDRLFIPSVEKGIFEVKNKQPVLLPNSEALINKRVNIMVPFADSSSILIGTENNGFYLYANGRINQWDTPAQQVLKDHQINRGIKIDDELYAVGTILGGVYILNSKGEIVAQINKEKGGLNNNTVLSFWLDKKNNLWVGLDNGIDLIKINSPLYYNTDLFGNIGSVYSSVIFQNQLYLGTNRGVFYKNLEKKYAPQSSFSLIPGSQGQVWELSVIDSTLFCGHNSATYIIERNTLRKISDITGGYQIQQFPFDRDYIVQGSYTGLYVYKKERGSWKYSHKINGFDKLSKIVAFERKDILWVSHHHQGLFRLELNDSLTQIEEIRSFFPKTKTYINSLDTKLVFSADSGFVYYDEVRNSFFPVDYLNNSLGNFSISAHFYKTHKNNYWVFNDGKCQRAIMDENHVVEVDGTILSDLNGYLIPGHENVYTIDSRFTLIYLDNGYAVFDKIWADNFSDWKPRIFLRKLTFSDKNGNPLSLQNPDPKIPFTFNDLSIQLSFPQFVGDVRFRYKLEGNSNQWFILENQEELVFQNLEHGQYTLRIVPTDGTQEDEVTFSFSVNPPWYRSIAARMLYVLLIVFMVTYSFVWNKRSVKKIQQKHEIEQKRLLEKEAAENEKRLIKMRNENLRKEIKLRNSRLAKSTFSLIHKNNTLITVKEELTKMKEELGTRFPSKHYNRIIRNIDLDITSENDWKMFEQSFSEVHENFLQKLEEEFTDLTPADLQLCAYLKMNLSSKEIASLLNISVRGVEIRRYRLRKKMKLDHDTNLVKFIMSYS